MPIMKQYLFRLAIVLLTYATAFPASAADIRRNALGMEFVFVPPGEFRMGTSPRETLIN